MKAVLVMDMPKNCHECRYCNDKQNHPSCALTNYAGGYQTMLVDDIQKKRSIWCPLRELPEKMDGLMAADVFQECKHPVDCAQGWNALRDKIVGGTE